MLATCGGLDATHPRPIMDGGAQEICDQATQLPEVNAVVTEVRSYEFGDGKDILAVRDRGKNLSPDPFDRLAIDRLAILD